MVPLALRVLLHDKIRLLIAVGGVSFAILLMLVLRGIMDGTVAKATRYVDNVGADIFIVQDGVEHFSFSTSFLPESVEAAAEAVPGVAQARGIVSVPLVVSLEGQESAIRLVGYDPVSGFGGPWSMASGTAQISADGTVLDQTLAGNHGIRLGDRVELVGMEFTVEGLSKETSALAGQLAFIDRDTAAQLLNAAGTYTNVLVKVDQDTSAEGMVTTLTSAIPQTSVMTRDELSASERELLGSLFVTPVNVMATIGLLVGIMVVGLTIYTSAAERLRDFGVLKAIGATNRYIYGVIIRQALLVGIAGFVVGLGAGYLVKPLVEYFVPDLGITYRPAYVAIVLAVSASISLLAAILPVYRIAGIDPKEVFKA